MCFYTSEYKRKQVTKNLNQIHTYTIRYTHTHTISDHSLIFAVRKYKLQKFSPTTKVRNFKHFSVDEFAVTYYTSSLGYDISFFDEILNKHARPLCNKRVRSRQSRWITPAIKQLMRNRDFHKKKPLNSILDIIGVNIRIYGIK